MLRFIFLAVALFALAGAGPVSASPTLIWRALANTIWDLTSSNWAETGQGLNGYPFTTGATVLFDDTTSNATVNIPAFVSPGNMTFNNVNSNYLFAGTGSIGGTGSLTESGAGTVTLNLNNSFSGGTFISAGRLRVGSPGALGSGLVTLNGGVLSAYGTTPEGLTNAVTITTATATLGNATDNGLMTFSNLLDFGGTACTLTLNSDAVFAGGMTDGVISSKQGNGTLTIKGPVNYTGPSDVQYGTVIFNGATVQGSDRLVTDVIGAGAARLVITNGTTVSISIASANLRAGRSASAGSNFVDVAGLYSLPNANTNSGQVTLQGNAAYSQMTFWPGGDFTARDVTNNGGMGNTVFNFNGGILRARNNTPNFFEGLTSTFIKSGGATIDDGGFTITINQNFLSGGGNGGLTKIGAGTLLLNGSNTYTGTTYVSQGTLGGQGIISGPVNIASGATLSPGVTATVSTLTISNHLGLNSGSTVFMHINPDYCLSDVVTGLTDVTYSGTLIVTNIGEGTWPDGQSYPLFSASAGGTGNFSSIIILPGAGATGTFNPATGQLTIHSGTPIPATPGTISSRVSGSMMNLSWPTNYLGWSLQVQTNNLKTGLSNNWVTLVNSSSITSNSLPMAVTNGAVFYRLSYPTQFSNPTFAYANSLGAGADPTVLYFGGYYYGSITGNVNANSPTATNAAIALYRDTTLGGLFSSQPMLVPLDPAVVGPGDAIWGPDMRYYGGHFYIYYQDHTLAQARVLVSNTSDPYGTYTDQAISFPNSWTGVEGYDWTIFQRSDGTYWAFFARGAGCCVAAMSSPTKVSRNAVQISQVATTGWETWDNIGTGCNEAEQVIAFPDPTNSAHQKIFVTYSANTYQHDDYAMGLLTFTGPDTLPLDDSNVAQNWTKHVDASGNPAPIFSKANHIVSVGSNAMFKDSDGTWWDVYGSRYYTYTNQSRQLRAQPIDISSGTPYFGIPVIEGQLFKLPTATAYPDSFITPAGTYDNNDPRIFYSNTDPNWTTANVSGAMNGQVMYNTRDRAYVMFCVVGSSLRISAPKGPTYGTGEVYADGVYQSDVNLYAASAVAPATVYTKTFSNSGQHTVMFVNVLSKANPLVNNPRLAVDSITTTP